jgi:Mrp family chromosome partitioning ATPase
VLAGEVALDAALIAVPEWRLTVLTAGSQFDNSTELLGSTEMRRLLDAVRTQFDRVVIDTPPAAPLADVGVVAPLVDGVIVVVRAGRTPKPAIERTLAGIDPERLLGLVLNDVEGTQPSYGSAATFSAGGAPSARRPGTDAGVGSPA